MSAERKGERKEEQGNGGERQCSVPCGFLYEDSIHMT